MPPQRGNNSSGNGDRYHPYNKPSGSSRQNESADGSGGEAPPPPLPPTPPPPPPSIWPADEETANGDVADDDVALLCDLGVLLVSSDDVEVVLNENRDELAERCSRLLIAKLVPEMVQAVNVPSLPVGSTASFQSALTTLFEGMFSVERISQAIETHKETIVNYIEESTNLYYDNQLMPDDDIDDEAENRPPPLPTLSDDGVTVMPLTENNGFAAVSAGLWVRSVKKTLVAVDSIENVTSFEATPDKIKLVRNGVLTVIEHDGKGGITSKTVDGVPQQLQQQQQEEDGEELNTAR